MKGSLKNDTYKKARGGPSRVLQILCAACGAVVCRYQKDGIGHLKRLYKDRILSSGAGVARVDLEGHLVCPACPSVIGVSYVYEREARPAYLLNSLAFTKKIVKHNA